MGRVHLYLFTIAVACCSGCDFNTLSNNPNSEEIESEGVPNTINGANSQISNGSPTPTSTPTAPLLPESSALTYRVVTQCSGANCIASCFAHETRRMKHVVYAYKTAASRKLGKDVDLKAIVTFPPGHTEGTLHPAIAFFHGGGLAQGTPTIWLPAAFYFASRGFVTATFQYRLKDKDGATTEESVADAISAMRWFNKFSVNLGINPNKVIAAGDSSGGYLALMTALYDDVAEDQTFALVPRLITPLYPVIDGTLAQYPPALSPLHLITGATVPNIHLLQGSADTHPWTPPATAKSFCNQLSQCTYVNFPNQEHAFLGGQHNNVLTNLDQRYINEGLISGDVNAVAQWVQGSAGHCKMSSDVSSLPSRYGF